MSDFPLGRRLSINGALCTVRYCGPLAGQKSDWLGVEWDEPRRGKHNGSHQGQQLFTTLSTWPKSASFIRTTRRSDEGRSFLEALRAKYVEEAGPVAGGDAPQATEISGKVVEEVGFEKIRRQQAELQDLKIVVLDGMQMWADASDSAEKIAATCPNIVELDLSRNLFEKWSDVARICAPLTRLRRLKASGLRLQDLENKRPASFDYVEELHLNDCLLKPEQIIAILCRHVNGEITGNQFPKLSSLSIAGNQLSTFNTISTRHAELVFPSIHALDLEGNSFQSLVPLSISLTKLFPNLHTLSLQQNEISSLQLPTNHPSAALPSLPSITNLDLSRNVISSPTFIPLLPSIYPSLNTLRITNNPISAISNSSSNSQTAETTFTLTLAHIPTLNTLNYSPITPRDRSDGELYYLSVAERALTALLQRGEDTAAAEKEWTRYAELCVNYERVNVLLQRVAEGNARAGGGGDGDESRPEFPPGSLGSRLVTMHFELQGQSPPTGDEGDDAAARTLSLFLPRSFDVYRVKGILLRKAPREWGLRALGFGLEVLGRGGAGGQEEGDVIPDSTRRIGDWISEERKECRIRVTLKEENRKWAEIGIGQVGLRRLRDIGTVEGGA